ncbi:lish motif-containing protein [Mycena metata]|uniref:Lish motif-containing protein n=1 Tax=Mycena metata TaxID=1033252 RepID=A0AAD7NT92_9AGAR|nr:lish motif-containing protein [Mycena metata]
MSRSSNRDPTPYELRTLVIDYLIHHGYSSTARAFAKSSMVTTSLDADGDEIMQPADSSETSGLTEETFAQVELRQKIRAHILGGRINDAIELLEKHFPAVLSRLAPSTPMAHKPLTGTNFVASTTLEPSHLNLNLRILAFTEAFRALPPDRVMHSTEESFVTTTEDNPNTTELLSKAQKLYVLAAMLRNPNERAAYTKELRNVACLLAYPDPENSPVAKYLSQERREAVANQINTAILYRTGFSAISRLELNTRYTSTLWSFLHDFRVKPRPGAPLPPTSIDRVASPSLIKGAKTPDKDASEVPRFDLQQFLNFKA